MPVQSTKHCTTEATIRPHHTDYKNRLPPKSGLGGHILLEELAISWGTKDVQTDRVRLIANVAWLYDQANSIDDIKDAAVFMP